MQMMKKIIIQGLHHQVLYRNNTYDEKSVCISEHGDGGPYAISETDLPPNVKVGEVYEKINGKYVYNAEVTKELNRITN